MNRCGPDLQPSRGIRRELPPHDDAGAMIAEDPQSPWILTRDDGDRLQLLNTEQPRQRPLCLDFSGAEIRRRASEGRKSLLARALGYKGGDHLICDMTAGLGRDMATCAMLGMSVNAWERNPIIYALLQDAWHRCPQDLQSRICLHTGSAGVADWQGADAVLYDPMYPVHATQKAAPALEMQQLRALLSADDDVDAVFAKLRAHPPRRLALKRPPRGARVNLAEADVEIRSGRVSWDVYLGPVPPNSSAPD